MKIRAKDFFNSTEKEKIRQAVESAESLTSGEIAVALVYESDRYRDAELMGVLSFATVTSLLLSIIFQYVTIWFFLPAIAVLYFPFLALFRKFPHMKLAYLSSERINEEVEERAVSMFFARGVHKTQERTGILIFISLLERKVWILGDEGINRKIDPGFWQSLVLELTDGIKSDRASEALCEVIRKCGAQLAVYFPDRAGDVNELPDGITAE